MLEMRPLRLMLALPRAGLYGGQYARAIDPGLREILRPNRDSLGKSAQEASRARPNHQFQPGFTSANLDTWARRPMASGLCFAGCATIRILCRGFAQEMYRGRS